MTMRKIKTTVNKVCHLVVHLETAYKSIEKKSRKEKGFKSTSVKIICIPLGIYPTLHSVKI